MQIITLYMYFTPFADRQIKLKCSPEYINLVAYVFDGEKAAAQYITWEYLGHEKSACIECSGRLFEDMKHLTLWQSFNEDTDLRRFFVELDEVVDEAFDVSASAVCIEFAKSSLLFKALQAVADIVGADQAGQAGQAGKAGQ